MAKIDAFLRAMVSEHGSDLHLASTLPPKIRVHGDLMPLDVPPIYPDEKLEILH